MYTHEVVCIFEREKSMLSHTHSKIYTISLDVYTRVSKIYAPGLVILSVHHIVLAHKSLFSDDRAISTFVSILVHVAVERFLGARGWHVEADFLVVLVHEASNGHLSTFLK